MILLQPCGPGPGPKPLCCCCGFGGCSLCSDVALQAWASRLGVSVSPCSGQACGFGYHKGLSSPGCFKGLPLKCMGGAGTQPCCPWPGSPGSTALAPSCPKGAEGPSTGAEAWHRAVSVFMARKHRGRPLRLEEAGGRGSKADPSCRSRGDAGFPAELLSARSQSPVSRCGACATFSPDSDPPLLLETLASGPSPLHECPGLGIHLLSTWASPLGCNSCIRGPEAGLGGPRPQHSVLPIPLAGPLW